MDLLTTQQKIEFARRDFLHVAGANDSIKWDECETIIKRYCSESSNAQITKLLSDADEYKTEMIELDKFMHVINYLVNEQIQEDHSPSSDDISVAERYENFTKAMQELLTKSSIIPAEVAELVKNLQQHNIPGI